MRAGQATAGGAWSSTLSLDERKAAVATILVVDDHSLTLRLLSYTLQKNGYTVLTALNGVEALQVLEGQVVQRLPVDLAIVDLAMPEMDGLTLLRRVRSNATARVQRLRFVMLTASGQDQDRLTARAEGVDDFLTKPTSSRELLSTVARLLN
jgi:CheY-like chemotaxis protein